MNKASFLQFIRVKPKEVKIVFLSFIFAMCIGGVQNILYSVPLAMFLSRYSTTFMPHIYVGAGLLSFCIGIAFGYLEKKATVFYVLAIPIVIFSASLFLFWGLLQTIASPVIFITLLIWAMLIGSLIISITMLLINQLFTTQQSKRIYGFLFGGIAIGGTLVGFGMNFLTQTIGSNHLILLAAILLGVSFLMQFSIRKNSAGKLHGVEEGSGKSKVSWKSFKNKKYIVQVFCFTAFVYFIFFSFDLLLNTLVQQRFPAENEMAVFFGGLFAIYDICALVMGFLVSSWLLTRFGLIASVLILPAGVAILLAIAVTVNLIPSLAAIVFPLILITAVFEVTYREVITEQSILLLFQPLRPIPRAWAQLKNETIISPLAMAVIGAILLLVNRYFGISLTGMGLWIVGLSIGGFALVFFAVKNGYLRLLIESLSKRMIYHPQFSRLTKDSLNALKSHLQSIYPEEAIYVLSTVENVDHKEFVKLLGQSLDSPLDQVRAYTLAKIEQYRLKGFTEQLKTICQTEKNPTLLGAALIALASVAELGTKYLYDPNLEVAASCVIALVRYGSDDEKKEAIQFLKEKANGSEEEKIMVAQVLKIAPIPEKSELLLALLQDESLEVRDVATQAAKNLRDPKLYHRLIENLEVPHVHDAAMQTLSSLGKDILDYVTKEFQKYSTALQIHLITALGFIKEGNPIEFLEKLLPTANRRLKHPILQSLKRLSYKSTNEEMIQTLLEAENENILMLKEMIVPFHFEEMKILHDFLCREIELSQECCFFLLAFVYPEEEIMQAKLGLSLDDEETNSNAVELLLQTLEAKDQKLLIHQLNYFPYKQHLESVSDEVEIKELLLKVRDYTSNCFIPALSAAVIYEIGILKFKSLIDVVIKQELKGDTLMQEIQPLSLRNLDIS